MRCSYSQCSTFCKCSRYWKLSYIDHWKGLLEGSSLAFGTATDRALTAMLLGQEDYLKIFEDNWDSQVKDGKVTPVFDNASIVYANADFNQNILTEEDKNTLKTWQVELGVEHLGTDGVAAYREASSIKKNPFKRIKASELQYWSRCSWLSLLRKGQLLLEAFHTQVYPKINKVIATQQFVKLDDNSGQDSLVGVIDAVLDLEGYGPTIIDFKTASQAYDESQLDTSEQLSLYHAMSSKTYNTTKVGYIVLVKNIPFESLYYCAKCGIIKNSQARSCDAEVEGNRCKGEWLEKKIPKPNIQVLITERKPEQIEELLQDYESIIICMKNGLHWKNTNFCSNWYGQPCIFRKKCWEGSDVGLLKK